MVQSDSKIIKQSSLHSESFINYLNQIGFIDQDDISIIVTNLNTDALDDIKLKIICLTRSGKQAFLDGDFIRAKELFHCAQEIIEAHPDMIKGDYRAFLYYEMCLFYRVLICMVFRL